MCDWPKKWGGQEILLPTTRVYPNILENDHTAFPGQSCGELLPNNPQRITTNQFAAQVASMVMNNLLHTKSISLSVINFNAQFGQMKPTFFDDRTIQQLRERKEKGDRMTATLIQLPAFSQGELVSIKRADMDAECPVLFRSGHSYPIPTGASSWKALC